MRPEKCPYTRMSTLLLYSNKVVCAEAEQNIYEEGRRVDELATFRKAKQERDRFHQVSEFLRGAFLDFRQGDIEGYPRSAIVVFVGDNGIQVAWSGGLTQSDLFTASDMIRVATHASLRGEDPNAAIDAEYRRRKEIADRKRQRIEEHRRTHPFECSHPNCHARFKSKGARTNHERHGCQWFGYDGKNPFDDE